jgi:hypothetical protein
MLPMPVGSEYDDAPISAEALVEVTTLAAQVHNEDCRTTMRIMMLLVWSLADEKLRYIAALGRHDLAAAGESAGEMRDLVSLSRVCQRHLRSVDYRG